MLKSNGFCTVLSFYLLFHVAKATEFVPCAHATGPLPMEVIIEGCDKLPCIFQRGTNISCDVVFRSPCEVSKMSPALNVQLGKVWMNFDAGPKDGCNSLVDQQCPLQEGGVYTYRFSIPVQKGYPKIRIKVEHEMKDRLKRPIFCYGIVGMVIN